MSHNTLNTIKIRGSEVDVNAFVDLNINKGDTLSNFILAHDNTSDNLKTLIYVSTSEMPIMEAFTKVCMNNLDNPIEISYCYGNTDITKGGEAVFGKDKRLQTKEFVGLELANYFACFLSMSKGLIDQGEQTTESLLDSWWQTLITVIELLAQSPDDEIVITTAVEPYIKLSNDLIKTSQHSVFYQQRPNSTLELLAKSDYTDKPASFFTNISETVYQEISKVIVISQPISFSQYFSSSYKNILDVHVDNYNNLVNLEEVTDLSEATKVYLVLHGYNKAVETPEKAENESFIVSGFYILDVDTCTKILNQASQNDINKEDYEVLSELTKQYDYFKIHYLGKIYSLG